MVYNAANWDISHTSVLGVWRCRTAGFFMKKKNLLLLLLNYCISTLIDWNNCYKHFTKSVNTWASATSSLQSSWMHPSPVVCVCVRETVFLSERLAWGTDELPASVQLTIYLLQHSHHILSQRLSTIQKNMVSQGVFDGYLSLCRWMTEKPKLSDDHKNSKCKCPLRQWFFN